MGRFVEGADRSQLCLLPECLDDWVGEDNPVQVNKAFVKALDLAALGFSGVLPAATGRPAYHPAALLKLYIWTMAKPRSSRTQRLPVGYVMAGSEDGTVVVLTHRTPETCRCWDAVARRLQRKAFAAVWPHGNV